MNEDPRYLAWMQRRRSVPTDGQFADEVMRRIRSTARQPTRGRLRGERMISGISTRLWAKVGVVAAAAIVAAIRILSVAASLH
jgi:hypothetical protein